jgi:hypothetical protein
MICGCIYMCVTVYICIYMHICIHICIYIHNSQMLSTNMFCDGIRLLLLTEFDAQQKKTKNDFLSERPNVFEVFRRFKRKWNDDLRESGTTI